MTLVTVPCVGCAGKFGPVWRITEGLFRLERVGMDGLSLVQLGLPGDLVGVEAVCRELNAILPARVYQRLAKREAWAEAGLTMAA